MHVLPSLLLSNRTTCTRPIGVCGAQRQLNSVFDKGDHRRRIRCPQWSGPDHAQPAEVINALTYAMVAAIAEQLDR